MTQTLDRSLLRACADQAEVILRQATQLRARPGHLRAYLATVELELPASAVRRWLDWTRRDLEAACLEVEDLREDAELDEAIARAGASLRELAAGMGAPDACVAASVAALNAQREARAARRALQLLVQAGGQIVGHEAFGASHTARKAICAARKEIGPDAIRTIRGRGFRITEAGMRAARAMRLSSFGEYPDSREAGGLPIQVSRKAAA